MSDDTRAGFFRSTYEGERAVDARFRPLAKRAAAIIWATIGNRPIEAGDRFAIMQAIDRELNTIYPETRGAASLLESDTALMARRGQARAIKSGLAPTMRMIREKDPELYQAINDAAAD